MTAIPVPQPMFISARLMAALKIGDDDVLHIEAIGRSGEGRVQYRYIIEHDGTVLHEADDISSGVGAEPDYREAMSTLLSFLTAAAEAYRYGMGGDRQSENRDLFPEPVMEWAYQMDSELQCAEMDLEEGE